MWTVPRKEPNKLRLNSRPGRAEVQSQAPYITGTLQQWNIAAETFTFAGAVKRMAGTNRVRRTVGISFICLGVAG